LPIFDRGTPMTLWVNRVGFAMSVLCLLCSALRTHVGRHAKSEKGHERTSDSDWRETSVETRHLGAKSRPSPFAAVADAFWQA
jgi:hypothetical protein